MKVLLFAKKDKPFLGKVEEYLCSNFSKVYTYIGVRGDCFPNVLHKKYDFIISYLSPWIIPDALLIKTNLYNINFHPGPPEYPGIGCFNFAIYNEEKEYGVTAHLMDKKVDTGKITAVKRFPIFSHNSVYEISLQAYKFMFLLFKDVFDYFLEFGNMPSSNEKWKCKPYFRSQLENLCKIDINMSKKEIEKRIKATTYPNMPGPYLELFGNKFAYTARR